MPRILLILLAAFGIWYCWQYIKSRPPEQRRRLRWVWGSAALLVVASLLVATGRMHWIGALIAAMIPLAQFLLRWLPRLLPLASVLGRKLGPSTFSTSGLKVQFDFATKSVSGELYKGPFAGKNLDTLDEQQLREQLAYFQQTDRQSAMLLQAYMLRMGYSGASGGKAQTDMSSSDVSESEAWQILGLNPGASAEEIQRAHKRLIQRLHPDRGGNDYLAAKINAARDRLIG